MTAIKNLHTAPLTIGAVTIPAGRTAEVPDWAVWKKDSNAVKQWLDAGVIKEAKGAADAEDGETDPAATDETKTVKKTGGKKAKDETPTLPVAPALPTLPVQE